MKKAEEFIPIMNKVSETVIVSGRQYWNREFIVRLIKQAQLEAIEETVNLCAKNAATVHDEKLLDEISPGLTSNDLIYKPSILNCAEILKKEIE